MTPALRLLTLNVSGPTAPRTRGLLEWLWARPEDLWVLTEIGNGEGARLLAEVCRAAGYTLHHSPGSGLGVLVVDRAGAILPEPTGYRRLAAVQRDGLRILGVYGAASDPVRYSSAAQRQTKRDWIAEFVPLAPAYDVIVGDLNLAPAKTLPYVLDEEVAAYAELTVTHPDAYHGDEHSWVDHTGAGVRYDHALVRAGIEAFAVLDQEPRTQGLTDHAALLLELSTDR